MIDRAFPDPDAHARPTYPEIRLPPLLDLVHRQVDLTVTVRVPNPFGAKLLIFKMTKTGSPPRYVVLLVLSSTLTWQKLPETIMRRSTGILATAYFGTVELA